MKPKEFALFLVGKFNYAAKDGVPVTNKEAALHYIEWQMKFAHIMFEGRDIQFLIETKKEIELL
jgi:hypothetical protein